MCLGCINSYDGGYGSYNCYDRELNVSAIPTFIVLITLMFALFDLNVSSLYSYDGYGTAIIAMTESLTSLLYRSSSHYYLHCLNLTCLVCITLYL